MSHFMSHCAAGNFDSVLSVLQVNRAGKVTMLRERDSINRWTCLHWAAWYSDIKWLKFFLAQRDVNIYATDYKLMTAFHVALQPRESEIRHHYTLPSLEIIEMLLQVNNDFVNRIAFFGPTCMYPLEYAIMALHIDAVKLLLRYGGGYIVEKQTGCTILQKAALNRRLDIIRYLVCEIGYDPSISCELGQQPCSLFLHEMMDNLTSPSEEEIRFFLELFFLTHKSPAESIEVCFLLLECFRWRDKVQIDKRDRVLFTKIVEFLLPQHPRKDLIEKILQILPDNYCLVTMTLFEEIVMQIEEFVVPAPETLTLYFGCLQILKSGFLRDLFAIFLVDESFFSEYLSAVTKIGWKFNENIIISLLRESFNNGVSSQKICKFVKSLIFHEFKYAVTAQHLPLLLPQCTFNSVEFRSSYKLDDHYLLQILIAFSNFVNVPIELVSLFTSQKKNCHFNFNESENWLNDYNKLLQTKSNNFELVSLKNLSRMSVRKYVFQNFTYSKALSTIYSLHIPIELRRFLCYNYSGFKL